MQNTKVLFFVFSSSCGFHRTRESKWLPFLHLVEMSLLITIPYRTEPGHTKTSPLQILNVHLELRTDRGAYLGSLKPCLTKQSYRNAYLGQFQCMFLSDLYVFWFGHGKPSEVLPQLYMRASCARWCVHLPLWIINMVDTFLHVLNLSFYV